MDHTIGIIGAGQLSTVLIKILVGAGYRVQISHGNNSETHRRLETFPSDTVSIHSNEEIVRKNEVIVLAVRWENIEEVLTPLRHSLKNKILIDATNPFVNNQLLFHQDDVGSTQVVASIIPAARIVKAFNTLHAEWMDKGPVVGNGRRVLFISGDDADSKDTVGAIITKMGFAFIDIGGLEFGSALQQGGKPLSGKNLVLMPDDTNDGRHKKNKPL